MWILCAVYVTMIFVSYIFWLVANASGSGRAAVSGFNAEQPETTATTMVIGISSWILSGFHRWMKPSVHLMLHRCDKPPSPVLMVDFQNHRVEPPPRHRTQRQGTHTHNHNHTGMDSYVHTFVNVYSNST